MKTLSSFLFMSVLAIATTLPAQEASVRPEKSEISCERDQDCVLLSNSCSSCCGQVAVSAKSRARFERKVSACVQRWEGPVCDCAPAPAIAKCKSKACALEVKK